MKINSGSYQIIEQNTHYINYHKLYVMNSKILIMCDFINWPKKDFDTLYHNMLINK